MMTSLFNVFLIPIHRKLVFEQITNTYFEQVCVSGPVMLVSAGAIATSSDWSAFRHLQSLTTRHQAHHPLPDPLPLYDFPPHVKALLRVMFRLTFPQRTGLFVQITSEAC